MAWFRGFQSRILRKELRSGMGKNEAREESFMSINGPRDLSGSAGSPSEPSAARDGDKTNWKPVYAAIAIAVALTLATVLLVNSPGTQATNEPPSPVTTPSVAPPRRLPQHHVLRAMGKGGSSKSVVEKVHPYTTRRNWEAVKRGARRIGKKDSLSEGTFTSPSSVTPTWT